jgi:hypothetical protein
VVEVVSLAIASAILLIVAVLVIRLMLSGYARVGTTIGLYFASDCCGVELSVYLIVQVAGDVLLDVVILAQGAFRHHWLLGVKGVSDLMCNHPCGRGAVDVWTNHNTPVTVPSSFGVSAGMQKAACLIPIAKAEMALHGSRTR